MSRTPRVSHPIYNLLPTEIEGFDSLAELALDMQALYPYNDPGQLPITPLRQPNGEWLRLEIAYLGDLDPSAVRIELYADGVDGDGPERQEMERVRQLPGGAGGYAYRAPAPAIRPATDYTARVIPQHTGVAVPLEDEQILWQR
jgi:hypothetical protein